MIYNDLSIILPEIFLSLYAMFALIGAVYSSNDKIAQRVTWFTAVIFILLAFWMIFAEEFTQVCIL